MNPKTILLLLYVGVGTVLSLISLPLILGKIGPNPWYGLRVRKTLDDPRVWYLANRYASWWLLATGALLIVAAPGVYVLFPAFDIATYGLVCLGIVVAGLIVSLVQSIRYLRRL